MSFSRDEMPTAPVNQSVLMTAAQATEALNSFPPDLQPLATAIARAFWDDGYMIGIVRGSRVGPLDRKRERESESGEKTKGKRK